MEILNKEDKEICFPFRQTETMTDHDLIILNPRIYTKKSLHLFQKRWQRNYRWSTNRYIEEGLIQNLVYPFEIEDKLLCIHIIQN